MADFIRMKGAFKKEFSPLDIQDLSFWIDASDLSTLSLSSVSPPTLQVDEWRDKGPNGYDLIQPTTSRKGEFLQNEQNGKNAIGFSESQYLGYFFSSGPNLFGANGDTFTYFIVNKTPLNNSNSQFGFKFYTDLSGTVNGSRFTENVRMASFFSQGPPQNYLVCDSPQTGGRYIKTISSTFFGSYNYNTFQRNGLNVEGFINGSSQGVISVTSTPSNFIGQGVLSVGDIDVFTMSAQEQISEIIIYKRALTYYEMNKVHVYLSNKYNI